MSNTRIYKSYFAFLNREDTSENGVSESFAAEYPDYEKQNESNDGCWDCSDCSRCSDCSGCSGLRWEEYKKEVKTETNETPEGASFCGVKIPVIENIHQKVLDAVKRPEALDMGSWHTCDTTHCRAGWVVHLAGKAGYELEQKTSTPFAAMQIYKASSPIRVFPPRFFDGPRAALADMERCAAEEINFQPLNLNKMEHLIYTAGACLATFIFTKLRVGQMMRNKFRELFNSAS